MKKVELLAPAGNFEVMKACISAGADAVYMGLSRFSARAYAENAEDETYIDAIDYAHLHGKKLYLTVNTLFKEEELYGELEKTLEPLYLAGLDAVIVQDLGAMQMIRHAFPDLPIHVSTQATVTGPGAAEFMKKMGAVRIVPARELSLREIRELRDRSGLELECFIHGALCYCYSGQCLFSSIAGGRSGNRGRCAQPCRMNYSVRRGERFAGNRKEGYVLSLKDLNTLDFLPELLDAGICSLKIEGRMKKAEYAAGVTSVYRKYLDLLEEKGKEGYRVSETDRQHLFSLFNRKGFSDGYYHRQNGRDMLTLTEPDFREEDSAFIREIREKYLNREHRLPITGTYEIRKDQPYRLTLRCSPEGRTVSVTVYSEQKAMASEQRSASDGDVRKQLDKLGGTGFIWEELSGFTEEGLFLPVSSLNEFRRKGIAALQERILWEYRRKDRSYVCPESIASKELPSNAPLLLSAQVRTSAQFYAVLNSEGADLIDLESTAAEAEDYEKMAAATHAAGKKIRLVFPQIYREKAAAYFEKNASLLNRAGFDGFLIGSLEEALFLRKYDISGEITADHNLYAFNSLAEKVLLENGFDRVTVPLELNGREIRNTGFCGQEMILYGRLPMMVSANCIHRTTEGCDGKRGELTLIDRMGNRNPVRNECRYCLNTIYNSLPLNLLDCFREISECGLKVGRIQFLEESGEEALSVLKEFHRVFQKQLPIETLPVSFTRGHFRRGVE